MYLVKIPSLNDIIWKRHLNQIKKFFINESAISKELIDEQGVSHNEGISQENSIVNSTSPDKVENINSDLSENRPKRLVKPVQRLMYN